MESTPTKLTEIRDALTRAMDGTIGVRNPKPVVLDQAQEAAFAVAEHLKATDEAERAEQLEQLGLELPGNLRAWLFELPSFLSKKERPEVGYKLCDTFAPFLGDAYFAIEKTAVRMEAGEKSEALAEVDEILSQHSDHAWVSFRAAQLHADTGDFKRARVEFDSALELARKDESREDLRFVYDGYISHLQEHGEASEAVDLSRKMMEDLPEIEAEFQTEQLVNEAPKVGRNDPCPCGSGKKFKKCCG